MPTKKGFSLIELLVTISILGILGSITSVAMINHGKKVRDAQRKSDMQTLKKAMESAKNDCSNAAWYPSISPLGSTLSSETYYFRLLPHLTGVNAKYLTTPINDPKFTNTAGGTGNYEFVRTTGAGQSAAGTIATCINPTTGLSTFGGTLAWVMRAKLEVPTDPESKKSYDGCLDKLQLLNTNYWKAPLPAANGDGYYYVCSE